MKYGGCHPTENSFNTKLECENFCPHIGPPMHVENEPCLTNETQPDEYESPGQPCIFPWKYGDIEYNGCANLGLGSPGPWCLTECSKEDCKYENHDAAGICNDNCPIADCDDPEICPKPNKMERQKFGNEILLQENSENFESNEDDCKDHCPEEETDTEFMDPKVQTFNSKVSSKGTKQNDVREKAIDYDKLF